MPSLRGKLDGGRIIVDVGVQPGLSVVPGVSAQASAIVLNIHPFRGLMDTGAQRTCITRSAAKSLALTPRGKLRIGNVSDINTHIAYSFAVGFWYEIDGGQTMNVAKNYYGFDPIMGADFKDNSDFDVLIGMDIISQGTLSTGRGQYEFTWP